MEHTFENHAKLTLTNDKTSVKIPEVNLTNKCAASQPHTDSLTDCTSGGRGKRMLRTNVCVCARSGGASESFICHQKDRNKGCAGWKQQLGHSNWDTAVCVLWSLGTPWHSIVPLFHVSKLIWKELLRSGLQMWLLTIRKMTSSLILLAILNRYCLEYWVGASISNCIKKYF